MLQPQPQNHTVFDPWNSTSTGHQRADASSSNNTQWRQVRTEKLAHQFSQDNSTNSTGKCSSRASTATATATDIRSYLGIGKLKRKRSLVDIDTDANAGQNAKQTRPTPPDHDTKDYAGHGRQMPTKIFAGTSIYINGSTAPTISDHRLKHLLVSHGAALSLGLARKTVTHVIVGRPSSPTPLATTIGSMAGGAGAGGGLAAGKLQREIERSGRQVKVVCVEWLVFYCIF